MYLKNEVLLIIVIEDNTILESEKYKEE